MPDIKGRWGLVAPFALGEPGKPVQILRTGTWNFRDIGPLAVTKDDLKDFVDNFKQRVRRQDLPITREHLHQYGAMGWIKDLSLSDDGESLYAVPEYTDDGAKEVKQGAWKYTSAELYREWEDPETGQTYKNVLTGYTHTNFPRIKDMQAISCAEPQVEPLSDSQIPPLPAALSDFVGMDDWQTFTDAEIAALLMAEKEHNTPQHVRDRMPTSAFAFVKQRKIIISRPGNVKAALGRFMQVQGVSDDERDAAWGRLKRAASRFGIHIKEASWRDLGKGAKNMAEVDPDSNTHGDMTTDGHSHGDYGSHSHSDDNDHSDAPKKKGKKDMSETQLSELQTQLSELKTLVEASEKRAKDAEAKTTTLETQLSEATKQIGIERETRLMLVFSEGLEKAKREGKINPAQQETYLSEGAKMSNEMRDFLIKDISARPKMTLLGESGSGAPRSEQGGKVNGNADRVELAERANAILKADPKLGYKKALLQANKELAEGAQ